MSTKEILVVAALVVEGEETLPQVVLEVAIAMVAELLTRNVDRGIDKGRQAENPRDTRQ